MTMSDTRTRLGKRPSTSRPPPPSGNGNISAGFPDDISRTPAEAILRKLIERPDITPIEIIHPTTNLKEFDTKANEAFDIIYAAASRPKPHELATIVRRVGQQPFRVTFPLVVRSKPELIARAAQLRNSGMPTLAYPQVLMPPAIEGERRDVVILGAGPELVNQVGDVLKQTYKPKNHMEIYNIDSHFPDTRVVMMYGEFEEELQALGLPQQPLWQKYQEAVDRYIEGLKPDSNGGAK